MTSQPASIDVPLAWLNFTANLPTALPPALNSPGSDAIAKMKQIRLKTVQEQEASTSATLPIPSDVRQLYRDIGRPTPLRRALALETALGTNSRIYFKREDLLPTGSFKLNSAIAQAYFAHQEGVRTLVTETGAGQWGHAVAYAARLFGLESIIFWADVSAQQKRSRRAVLGMLNAQVHEAPSEVTAAGRALRASGQCGAGSLGTAIGEAISYANEHPEVRYISGSNVPHVLIHQTVIGVETREQLVAAGDDADVLIAAVGGGSNLMGLMAAFLDDKYRRGDSMTLIGAESAAAPRLTEGEWRYDNADPFGVTPLTKSFTLGKSYELPVTHIGGLRQHSGSTAVGVLRSEGLLDAIAYNEREAFETGREILRLEGFLPAPESAHAIRAAIERARLNRDETIVACISGNGLLDIEGYVDAFPGIVPDLH